MAKVNISLVKQALTALQANKRQTNSHTKTRGEVAGGGRKPWRQKGTGRARAGSSRSPIWSGGGITFGPDKNRTFKQSLPKKMNKKAVDELMKHLVSEKRLTVVKSLAIKDAKTKTALELLNQQGLMNQKVLFVTENIEPELVLAVRNIKNVKVTTGIDLSILDMVGGTTVMEEAVATKRGLSSKTTEAKPTTKKTSKETK